MGQAGGKGAESRQGPEKRRRRGWWKRWLGRLKMRLMNVYPPFLGAGIRVRRSDPEDGAASIYAASIYEVRLKLTGWNKNYVGTQFGGSLYSMCDPFYMLILLEALGPAYVVWDKAAAIRFVRPGRTAVTARFELPAEEIDRVRRLADSGEKVEPLYTVQVRDTGGELVAEVDKRLYIRKKRPSQEAQVAS